MKLFRFLKKTLLKKPTTSSAPSVWTPQFHCFSVQLRCNRVLLFDPSFRFKAINKNNDNVENPKEEEEEEEEQQQCVHDVAKAVANKKESGSNTTLLDWKKDPVSKFQGCVAVRVNVVRKVKAKLSQHCS